MVSSEIILPCACGELHRVRTPPAAIDFRCRKSDTVLHYLGDGEGQHRLTIAQSENAQPLDRVLTETELTLGRQGDWALEHPALSRVHCVLKYRDGTYYLRDNSSRNGTFLNEKCLTPADDWQPLVNGDLLRLADLMLRYLAPQAAATPELTAADLSGTGLDFASSPHKPSSPIDDVDRMLGKKLGNYTLKKMLAQGGMGRIYLAENIAGETYVIKTILPESLGDADTAATLQRFLREMDLSLNLAHPHIIKYYDVGQKGHFLYIVMEYFHGRHLRHWFTYTPATYPQVLSLGQQAARALGYAHQHGIIHRDIKPENILYDPTSGVAKIIDFGVAKGWGDGQTLTAAQSFIGTLRYMAPEQAMFKQDVDERADIFSLGATLYYCLAGRAPFEEAEKLLNLREQIKHGVPPLAEFCDHVPPDLAKAIEKALQIEPDARYATADDFAATLASCKL